MVRVSCSLRARDPSGQCVYQLWTILSGLFKPRYWILAFGLWFLGILAVAKDSKVKFCFNACLLAINSLDTEVGPWLLVVLIQMPLHSPSPPPRLTSHLTCPFPGFASWLPGPCWPISVLRFQHPSINIDESDHSRSSPLAACWTGIKV